MEVHWLSMTPILFMYKLIGGLPYNWHEKTGKQVRVIRSNRLTMQQQVEALLQVKRDRPWTVWSIVFGFLIVAYFSYGGLRIRSVFSRCATTFSVILKVEDFIGMLTTVLLRIHMLGEAPALAKALVRMQHLCETYGFKANPYYWDKPIAIAVGHHVFGFICIAYGNISMAVLYEERFEFFRIANLFEATVKPMVFNLFMMIYSRLVDIQAMAYEEFIAKVTEENDPTVNIWPDHSEVDQASWIDVPDIGPASQTGNMNVMSNSSIKKTQPSSTGSFDTEKAKELLFDLHDAHVKVKNYCQFLTGLNLLHSTVSGIVSCFLITIKGDQYVPEQVATLGLLVMTLFPIFFLTNIPRHLNFKVRLLTLYVHTL